jgi:hypothetical protein
LREGAGEAEDGACLGSAQRDLEDYLAIADDMKARGQSNVKTRAKQRFKYFQATSETPTVGWLASSRALVSELIMVVRHSLVPSFADAPPCSSGRFRVLACGPEARWGQPPRVAEVLLLH